VQLLWVLSGWAQRQPRRPTINVRNRKYKRSDRHGRAGWLPPTVLPSIWVPGALCILPPYHMATMCHRPGTPTPLRTSITLELLPRTAIIPTPRLLKATTLTLRRTAIMPTLRLLKATTPTLRPRKVTNRRQESGLAVNVCFWHEADVLRDEIHVSF
jgi:hypothetical protein